MTNSSVGLILLAHPNPGVVGTSTSSGDDPSPRAVFFGVLYVYFIDNIYVYFSLSLFTYTT